tara:strand:- start:26 stop:469 length:444 start_codon:yes stop_codon:yes gene_type:complete
MNTNDYVLPFLNRLLYSFSSGDILWDTFVDNVRTINIFVNKQPINDHQQLYAFLYNTFNQNKLLTKYALASCTQVVLKDIYHMLGQQLTDIKSYMSINIKTTSSGLIFHVQKQQDPHMLKQISIQFEIKKHITSMNLDQVSTSLRLN